MGLDAVVPCNCLKEGKAKPPPVPVERVECSYAPVSSQNNILSGWTEDDNNVYEWQKTACEHPNMRYVTEWIASWFGYTKFKKALSKMGWVNFPTLFAELPRINSGSTSHWDAVVCLWELKVFEEKASFEAIFLLDADTDTEIYSYISPYQGVFIMDTTRDYDYGIDREGFFVFDRRNSKYLFRSTQFSQYKGENDQTRFLDVLTGTEFKSTSTIHDSSLSLKEPTVPQHLRVETRQVGAEYFRYILQPLTNVFQASIEMHNPVCWG
jgi:hypothetical protein